MISASGFGLGSNLGAASGVDFSVFSLSSFKVSTDSLEVTSSEDLDPVADFLAVGAKCPMASSTANAGQIGSLKLSFS